MNADPLVPEKLFLIDHAIEYHGVKTFADLGGFWGVLGGYSLHAVNRGLTGTLVDLKADHENLSRLVDRVSLLKGNFGTEEIAKQINVDCLFLFDVLVHQVMPDWDYVLKLYSERAKVILIYNQQWVGGRKTVRLPDLGKEAFLIETPNTEYPDFRDNFWFWQWGITFDDLVNEMKFLGFRLDYFRNCGKAWELPNFELHSYCFVKI
jgi:hypothetical protein